MIDFEIRYIDGSLVLFHDATEVCYSSNGSSVKVGQDNMANWPFPVGHNLWLYSKTGSLSVSGDGMRSIQIIVK